MSANTVTNLLASATQQLTEAGCDTPRLDAEVLLAHTLDKDRTWLYRYPDKQLEPSQKNAYAELVARREKREPVAYIVGTKAFFGLEFLVDNHVLIPRPETELLVETVIESTKHKNQLVAIVDVGTGSGCIAVSLAKQIKQAAIFAADISPEALNVARQNAARHQVSNQITFLNGDLLAPLNTPVDIVASNPPYVSRSQLAATIPEVNQFEPQTALDGGTDGLDIIERLIPAAKSKLKPGGCLLIEIGFDQGQAVKNLAETHFSAAKTQIKQDLAGLDRLLVIQT